MEAESSRFLLSVVVVSFDNSPEVSRFEGRCLIQTCEDTSSFTITKKPVALCPFLAS